MVAYLARRISEYTVKEIADHFPRSSVTVSEAIRKVEDLLQKDKTFAKQLELLIGNLIKRRKTKYRITEAWPYLPFGENAAVEQELLIPPPLRFGRTRSSNRCPSGTAQLPRWALQYRGINVDNGDHRNC